MKRYFTFKGSLERGYQNNQGSYKCMELLTLKEVAEMLKLSESTIYGMLSSDGRASSSAYIPASKVGGSWRFDKAEVEYWLKNSCSARMNSGASEENTSYSPESVDATSRAVYTSSKGDQIEITASERSDEMSLRKRGEIWHYDVTYKGKRVRGSCDTTLDKEAKKIQEKVLTRLKYEYQNQEQKEEQFFEKEEDGVTFEELAEDLVFDYKINERKSLERVKISIKNLSTFFSGMKMASITSDDIKAYISERNKSGRANATINRELAALKRMFRIGYDATPQKIDRVPKIMHLTENNVREEYFEHHEYEALLENLPDYLKPVAAIAYYTGMRKSEILNLKWSQVELGKGRIFLHSNETKNGKSRIIYMGEDLHEIITIQKATRDKKFPKCPYICMGKTGEQIKDFRDAWKKVLKKTKLENKRPHDFRRTAVRNMVRSDVKEDVAMKVSGHKTRSVFDRYNITNEDDLKEVAEKVQAHLRHKSVTKTDIDSDMATQKESSEHTYH